MFACSLAGECARNGQKAYCLGRKIKGRLAHEAVKDEQINEVMARLAVRQNLWWGGQSSRGGFQDPMLTDEKNTSTPCFFFAMRKIVLFSSSIYIHALFKNIS